MVWGGVHCQNVWVCNNTVGRFGDVLYYIIYTHRYWFKKSLHQFFSSFLGFHPSHVVSGILPFIMGIYSNWSQPPNAT